MKTRFKRGFTLFAACTVLFLAACGSGGTPSATDTTANTGSQKANENSGQNSGQQTQTGEVMTFRLGHLAPEASNYHAFAVKFKELVESKTQGKVKIDIYPFRQLGGDRELLEAMQFGNLEFGVITSAPIANFAPQFAAMDLPYLFKDWDHAFRFAQSDAAKELMKETESKGLISLAFMPRGFRHVTTNKPYTKPEDMEGLKLRVLENPLYVDTFKAMGASPQAMSFADGFTAMQQGAIDGQENTLDVIHDERIYEVQKSVWKTGHMMAFASFTVSKALFDQWPADLQKIVVESAQEANISVSEGNKKNEEEYQKKLTDLGLTFYEVDREKYREMVKGVYDSFIEKNGDKYLKAIEALRN